MVANSALAVRSRRRGRRATWLHDQVFRCQSVGRRWGVAVVSLGPGEPEQALFEDGMRAVPEGDREGQRVVVVADPAEAVLAPSIGARPRVIGRRVFPSRSVAAVVLAHGSPLALAEVW